MMLHACTRRAQLKLGTNTTQLMDLVTVFPHNAFSPRQRGWLLPLLCRAETRTSWTVGKAFAREAFCICAACLGWGSQERCRCVVAARRFRVSLTAFVPLEQGEHAKRTWESWDGERLRGFCVPDHKPGHVSCPGPQGTCVAPQAGSLLPPRRNGNPSSAQCCFISNQPLASVDLYIPHRANPSDAPVTLQLLHSQARPLWHFTSGS